jgi:hypothetical protein
MTEKKSFLLRVPPELWADLQRLAAADLRSVNAEIEYLLRRAVSERLGGKGGGDDDQSARR